MTKKLMSWNVNGLRAVLKRDFIGIVKRQNPDVLCLQETKCQPDQVELDLGAYHQLWNSAEKKGYSGTLILTKQEPIEWSTGMGIAKHDNEGRIITAEYPEYYLVNVYTPNAKRGLERLPYRQKEWDVDFANFIDGLQARKPVLTCGDFNVAHQEIDLANPKSNRRNAGFTDEEREGFSNLLDRGLVDTFREFEQGGGHYTWWSQRPGVRERNIGWRIDYFLASTSLRDRLKSSKIHPKIYGSDHCPVSVTLE